MVDLINFLKEDKNGGSGKRSDGSKHLQSNHQNVSQVLQPGLDILTPNVDRTKDSVTGNRKPLYNSRIIIVYVEYLKKYHPNIDNRTNI
jgi:hypothetical protein